jgi:L-ascorbate metabolism protein UlaG (beta-lactamase superfamily)
MKNKLPVLFAVGSLILFLAGCATGATAVPSPTETAAPASVPATPTSDLPPAVAQLHWFGTAAVLFHGTKNIYFDPVNLSGDLPPADLILISHAHSDHADLASLQQIIGPDTVLIISPNVTDFYEQNKDALGILATVLAEGETTHVGDISIRAVPAYDSNGGHPREAGGVGYVATIDGQKIYFAGGTNYFPEMAQIESDVTLYPMYARADAEKVIGILPTKVFIPIHTSGTGASAYAVVFAKLPTKIKFVALNDGPYNP